MVVVIAPLQLIGEKIDIGLPLTARKRRGMRDIRMQGIAGSGASFIMPKFGYVEVRHNARNLFDEVGANAAAILIMIVEGRQDAARLDHPMPAVGIRLSAAYSLRQKLE
jgi:hypothetical protein